MTSSNTYRHTIGGIDNDSWNKLCSSFSGLQIYQDGYYGRLHSRGIGRSHSRVAVFSNDGIEAVAQLRLKKFPLIPGGVAEIDWGPLWHHDREPISHDGLGKLLEILKEEFVGQRGMQLRIRPYSTFSRTRDHELHEFFTHHGFSRNDAVRPYHTVVIGLTDSLDAIRSKLHQKWRNQLNLAERSELQCEFGTSMEHFDRFLAIYKAMWNLKRFPTGVRVATVRRVHLLMSPDSRFLITLVRREGTDIGATVCAVRGGTMLYFLGATLPGQWKEYRPGYLLQWRNICRAKELSLRWYDMGGYDDNEPELARWKKRTNGELIVFPGQYEVGPNGRYKSALYSFAENAFRAARRKIAGR